MKEMSNYQILILQSVQNKFFVTPLYHPEEDHYQQTKSPESTRIVSF